MPFYNLQRKIQKALTVQIVGAYDANDVMGGLLTFDVSNAGGGGTIRTIRVIDADNEKAALTIYWFSTAPAAIADGAAFAPAIADLKKLFAITTVTAGNYVTYGSFAQATIARQAHDFVTTDGNIYAYVACTATPAYTAATDLTLVMQCYLDG